LILDIGDVKDKFVLRYAKDWDDTEQDPSFHSGSSIEVLNEV
jgi:hypothetical protein